MNSGGIFPVMIDGHGLGTVAEQGERGGQKRTSFPLKVENLFTLIAFEMVECKRIRLNTAKLQHFRLVYIWPLNCM